MVKILYDIVIPIALQVQFMTLAINIIYGHRPSNKMCHRLQPKKTKVTPKD